MDLGLIGSIIGGVTSIFDTIFNTTSQSSINRKQIEAAYGLQKDQQQYLSDMYDKSNAYNSPTQQMQRLVDAGLNPNLVYGQGSTNVAGVAGVPNAHANAAPNLHAPQMNLSAMSTVVGQWMQAEANTNLLKSNSEAAKAKAVESMATASKLLAETPGAKAQSKILENRAAKASELLELEMNDTSQRIQTQKSLQNYYDNQSSEIKYRVQHLNPAQKSYLEARTKQLNEQVSQEWARVAVAREQNAIGWKNAAANMLGSQASMSSAGASWSHAAAANVQASAAASEADSRNASREVQRQIDSYEADLAKHGFDPHYSGMIGNVIRFGLQNGMNTGKLINSWFH